MINSFSLLASSLPSVSLNCLHAGSHCYLLSRAAKGSRKGARAACFNGLWILSIRPSPLKIRQPQIPSILTTETLSDYRTRAGQSISFPLHHLLTTRRSLHLDCGALQASLDISPKMALGPFNLLYNTECLKSTASSVYLVLVCLCIFLEV